jgi:type VI protein secretion system component Hcp
MVFSKNVFFPGWYFFDWRGSFRFSRLVFSFVRQIVKNKFATYFKLLMENLTVVEMGAYISAPLASQQLQHLGAKVTSVKRPSTARGAMDERRWNDDLQDA